MFGLGPIQIGKIGLIVFLIIILHQFNSPEITIPLAPKAPNFSNSIKTSVNLIVDQETQITQRFKKRNFDLTERCKQLQQNGNSPILPGNFWSQLFIPNNSSVFACLPGKTGSSTVKIYFASMNPQNKKNEKGEIEYDEDKFKAKFLLPKDEVMKRMLSSQFTKIMTVRHPLARLLSAYKDKFTPGRYSPEEEKFFIDLAHKFVPETIGSTEITLTQFLKMVVAEWKETGEIKDGHWKPAYASCCICNLPYDYIIKQETFKEDWDHVLKVTGIKNMVDAPDKVNAFGGGGSHHDLYFESLEKELLRDIYTIYEEDFKIFGYQIPTWLMNIVHDDI